jgi:acyl-CoA synthetase (AMP-forming)/AMP-acid ligase II/acyl carrier protein
MCEQEPQSLIDVLLRHASHRPDDVLYRFEDSKSGPRSLTFAELVTRARAIAAQLQVRGLVGGAALLMYPPGLSFVEAFLACLHAGVVAVPVIAPDSVRLLRSLPRLRAIVSDIGAGTVLSNQEMDTFKTPFLDGTVGGAPLDWIDTDAIPDGGASDFTAWRPAGDAIAFVQYTSGSTSAPRGVKVSHANIVANERAIAEACGLSSADRGVSWLPLFHDMGLLGGVLQPLYSGFPVRLLSPITFLKRPIVWLREISDFAATISPAPNFAYAHATKKIRAEQLDGLNLAPWKCALNGSEPVQPDVLEQFAAKFAPCGFQRQAFYPCYGLAEATLLVSGAKPPDAAPVRILVRKDALHQHRVVAATAESADTQWLVACGESAARQDVRIVDPTSCKPCAPDEIGEIWVRGPSVAQGYWNRPEETEAVFGATLPGAPDVRYLRTGDLGFFSGAALFITGRCKDLVIVRGRNHYPQDIEATVAAAHPKVVSGGVAAFAVQANGEEGLAVAVELSPQPEGASDARGIEDAVRQAVARDHDVAVAHVVFLPKRTIPKTSSGKLQRSACRDQFLAGTLPALRFVAAAVAPAALSESVSMPADPGRAADEIRAWLLDQLATLLELPRGNIDPGAALFTYGLDSYKVMTLVAAAEAWLGRPIDPVVFYEYPSVDLLVGYFAGAAEQARPPRGAT